LCALPLKLIQPPPDEAKRIFGSEELTIMPARTASVLVSKAGPTGRPTAEVLVAPGTNLGDIGRLIEKVYGDKSIAKAAGLRFCGGCYSGLDILIKEKFQQQIEVEF
jgi:hypothetical protein